MLGMMIVLLGLYFLLFVFYALGAVVIVIGGYFVATGLRTPSHRQITGKVSQVIYASLRERGLERIKTGQLHATEQRFLSVLDKLQNLLALQSDLPEIGFDAIFFHCRTEKEANQRLVEISGLGLDCSLMQEKSDWQIKISL